MDPVERLSTEALLDEADRLKTTYEAALRELPDELVQFGTGRFDEALSRYFDVSNELRIRRRPPA